MSYTEGGAELARAHAEDLPEKGRALSRASPPDLRQVGDQDLQLCQPRIPGLHSGRWSVSFGRRRSHLQLPESLCRGLDRRTRVDPVGDQRGALVLSDGRVPEEAQGLLTSGGSMANFIAIATARRERLPDNFLKGTLYCSDQVHHSVTKAAMLAGFPADNIRVVPANKDQQISIDRLRDQVQADHRSGFEPFLVVGSAGTVNTGAVDDIPSLADLAAELSLWLHIDGAYGGFFVLTQRGQHRLRGLSRADSITLDPTQGPLSALWNRLSPGSRRCGPEASPSRLGRLHAPDAGRAGPDRFLRDLPRIVT